MKASNGLAFEFANGSTSGQFAKIDRLLKKL
jgi:hypothetical protein